MEKEELFTLVYGAGKNGATAYLFKDINCIFLVWKGFVHFHEFKEILSIGIDEVARHKITCWLADTTDCEIRPDEYSKWVEEVWIPKIVSSGLEKFAVVLPENGYNSGDAGIVKLIKKLSRDLSDNSFDIEYYYTTDLSRALEWIKLF